jgi:hypothetical protein
MYHIALAMYNHGQGQSRISDIYSTKPVVISTRTRMDKARKWRFRNTIWASPSEVGR